MKPLFDPAKHLPETTSAVLAAMIYDEDLFAANVYRVFGFETHAWTDSTQRYYYSVVIDTENDRLFIVFRGTDGRNSLGRALSWLTINLRAGTTPQGFHEGFWRIAKLASKKIAPYLKKYSHVYLVGHSQGSGVGTSAVAQICRKIIAGMLENIKHFQADLFCSPPAVNETGKAEIDEYCGKSVHINNWVMPGDLISKKKGILRGLLNGKDVGEMRQLPDMILPKYGVFDPVSHSPYLMLRAYGWFLIDKEGQPPKSDLKLIEYVLNEKMVVN
jgi:hypothetical protein